MTVIALISGACGTPDNASEPEPSQYEVVREGDGAAACIGDLVWIAQSVTAPVIHDLGVSTRPSGTGGEVGIRLGSGTSAPWLDELVEGMRVGERRRVVLDPGGIADLPDFLGFDARGIQILSYEVELIDMARTSELLEGL